MRASNVRGTRLSITDEDGDTCKLISSALPGNPPLIWAGVSVRLTRWSALKLIVALLWTMVYRPKH